MDLAMEIYVVTQNFPREEVYGLVSQLRRAAVSVPSNIAEGAVRARQKEFLQFMRIAQGSLSEIDTQLELSKMLGYISDRSYENIEAIVTMVSKQLFGLTRSIKNRM